MGSLKNQILISMPHMRDPFFSKAVVYICEHNKNGAMGMIINKKLNSDEFKESLDELFSVDNSLDLFMKDIFFGGPVLPDKGIVLHHSDYISPKSISVSKSIYITSKQDALGELEKNKQIPYKLMLGHAGWSAGQLEREIENGDWLIQNTTSDFVFNVPPKQMWAQANKSLGIDLGLSG
jgi:putative transcriptional regulator